MAAIYRLEHNDNLADAIDRIIDRGITIPLWTCISLAGIELELLHKALLLAPVETYLSYARKLALTSPQAAGVRIGSVVRVRGDDGKDQL